MRFLQTELHLFSVSADCRQVSAELQTGFCRLQFLQTAVSADCGFCRLSYTCFRFLQTADRFLQNCRLVSAELQTGFCRLRFLQTAVSADCGFCRLQFLQTADSFLQNCAFLQPSPTIYVISDDF
ncbi:hypothetical protein DUNSADRAFT_10310 [Dunaliella salina]|uniref:Encoded protein n=1 Tax=Dunaliella salina TaxID=3046 RepID=A0ABQ7GFJ4_DUNSA|nr:hypothetical protein DUNSADRAFT_10310 [Dunaliella salina]|eukprot:KAF5833378.1 hypothetical protein DUNSADRAFT_10310 [Dunaliella salina]